MFFCIPRSVVLSTALLAVLVLAGSAADPSGLFAIVSWTGGSALATWWWWAPYAVYFPLLLVFYGAASTHVTATTRRGLFVRSWLLAIIASDLAWVAAALAAIYGGMTGESYVLPVAETVRLLVWASGYAACKIACIAWLPALCRLVDWHGRAQNSAQDVDRATLAVWATGLVMLGLALLVACSGLPWWQQSPMAYAYRELPGLLAPQGAAAGMAHALMAGLALLIFGSAFWYAISGDQQIQLARGRKLTVLLQGGLAGALAACALFGVQIGCALLCAVSGKPAGFGVNDYWMIPTVVLLAVEFAGFTVVAAVLGVVATGLVLLLRDLPQWPKLQTRRAWGSTLVVAALLIVVLPVWRVAATARHAATNPAAITVRHDSGHAVMATAGSAQVILRGVNVNQLGSYYQADPSLAAVQVLRRQDFVDIAALGLNVVRLTLSWSRLEPQRGQFSAAYLDAIRQAVDWAAENHVYVVLDMHQDAWSATVNAGPEQHCRTGTEPMKGWDGAPAWATLTDATPACQFTGRDLAPNVSRAFQSFYLDRDGIQTELIHAWAILASSFADDTNVVGYDLLNEPNFAENPPVSSTLLLTNFYARAIAAIRRAERNKEAGYPHPIIIEPSIFWSGFGVDNLPPAEFLHDAQLVFSPHLYNESITSDQDLGINLVSIERGFRLAQHAANQLDAALWIGEWGYFGDSAQQARLWQRQADIEDQMQTGSALWVWKQSCGDPHVYPGKLAGNIVQADCPGNVPNRIDPLARRILQRAYVRKAPGRLLDTAGSTAGFSLAGNAVATTSSCELEVWLPGALQPTLGAVAGISAPRWQRVEPGSVLLGSSGGWLWHACVAGGPYLAEFRFAPLGS